MTEVTIVRHGETAWNRDGRQQGWLNSDLTETGILQAEAIRDSIDENSDILISSDLGRAVQTAEIIREKLKIDVELNQGLRERNLGVLQGLTIQEFAEGFPSEFARFKTRDPDYELPEGESSRQRYERNIAALNEIVDRNAGKNIFIVAHGGVLDSLIRHTLSIPVETERAFSLINGSINRFSYISAWRLECWGVTAHLTGLDALDDS